MRVDIVDIILTAVIILLVFGFVGTGALVIFTDALDGVFQNAALHPDR